MSSLTEFLKSEAGYIRDESVRLKAAKLDWQRAAHDMVQQMIEWLKQADPDSLLRCQQVDHTFEDYDLGKYLIKGLVITLGRSTVRVIPSHLDVVGVIQMPGETTRRRIDGRFELSNGIDRIPLYRVKDGDRDVWLWWTHGGGGRQALRPRVVRGDGGELTPMMTLDDAWRWYGAVRQQAKLTKRFAEKHWAELPWDGSVGRDAFTRELNPEQLGDFAAFVAEHIDDLAVLVLFSVFEATVREAVLAKVKPEVEQLRHPSLRHAAEEACEAIANGSFFRVLDPFKADGHADLIEQVNQVRRDSNWVAHGRRGDPPATVEPDAAYDRLSRFLQLMLPISDAKPPAAGNS